MSWAACCSNKQMQDMFFGESSGAMFKAAAQGRREATCQWCYEHVQMFVVGKSLVWICDNCKGVCEACEKCGSPVSSPTLLPAWLVREILPEDRRWRKTDLYVGNFPPPISLVQTHTHTHSLSLSAAACESQGSWQGDTPCTQQNPPRRRGLPGC